MFEYVSVITKKQVLERFTQEDIFGYILKDAVELDRKYCAPYRIDKNPGCFFSYYNDTLFFVDFGNFQTHFDCFSLYSKVYSVSMEYVYEHIWNNVTNCHYYSGASIKTKRKTKTTNKITKISILTKEWQTKEINYWKDYGITVNQLKQDKVYPIKAFMIENGSMNYSTVINNIGFAYTDFDRNHKKIYQPYNKSDKWFTNCNANDIGNINMLVESGYFLIITKSYKDCRVIRNLGFNCIWFQNEGMCPSNDKLKNLSERFEKIFVFYDNDQTGLKASREIANKISVFNKNVKDMHLPVNFFNKGIKDASDFVKTFDYNLLQEFLKKQLQHG